MKFKKKTGSNECSTNMDGNMKGKSSFGILVELVNGVETESVLLSTSSRFFLLWIAWLALNMVTNGFIISVTVTILIANSHQSIVSVLTIRKRNKLIMGLLLVLGILLKVQHRLVNRSQYIAIQSLCTRSANKEELQSVSELNLILAILNSLHLS